MKKSLLFLLLFSIGTLVFGEDFGWGFSSQNERVYRSLNGNQILLQNIDAYSFSLLELEYFSDKNGVYRFTTNCREATGYTKIPGADISTFEPISVIYSKDAYSVFRGDDCSPYQKIVGVDLSTWKPINNVYSHDKNYFYYHASRVARYTNSYSFDNSGNLIVSGQAYIGGTSKDNFDTVLSLVEKNIIARRNTSEEYRLHDKILRQEVIGMALKIRGIELPNGYLCKGYFSDVRFDSQNNWVCRAMELAADNGIISRANIRARPGDFITGSEALAIIMQAAQIELSTNTSRNGYSGNFQQWQIDIIATAIANSILSSKNFKVNDLAYRGEVFMWTNAIISKGWQHEGIDLSFKNVNENSGTFDFCVSGEKSLADLGVTEVYPNMISGIVVNSVLYPILGLMGGACLQISFTQTSPSLSFKLDFENRVNETNESNNFYLN